MPEHSTAVDMWAVGCIFAEMILRRELFPGRSVSNQIKIILHNLGTPPKEVFFTKNFKIFQNFILKPNKCLNLQKKRLKNYIFYLDDS